MKQRFLFIRLLWDVLKGKESGWVFFKMSDQQQMGVLAGDNKVDIDLRYIGIDEKVIAKIVKRLEKDTNVSHKN